MVESVPAAAGLEVAVLTVVAFRGFLRLQINAGFDAARPGKGTIRQGTRDETREEKRLNLNCEEPLPWENNTLIRLTIPLSPPS